MPLVELKCPSCGGLGKYDADAKTITCPFCGTKSKVEDIINNYNTNYNFNNANVTLNDDRSFQNILTNAEINLRQFKEFDTALTLFNEASTLKPGDYRGWWGIIRTKTKEFTVFDFGNTDLAKLEKIYNKAVIVAPDSEKEQLKIEWETFLSNRESWIRTNINSIGELQSKKAELERNLSIIETGITNLRNQLNILEANRNVASKREGDATSYRHRETTRKIIISIVALSFITLIGMLIGFQLAMIALAPLLVLIIVLIIRASNASEAKRVYGELTEQSKQLNNIIDGEEKKKRDLLQEISELNSQIETINNIMS